jgi:Sigma-70, region 4
MARIDELPPDQRAALQLLLKQGRSYEEIAQLLRIEPSAVRERARAALDALGPDDVDGLSLERQDEVADYLLGQQSASLRASTRAFLEESAPGRAWARVVAGELRPMAGDNLPEIPSEAAEVDEAFDALQARTEHREKTERSSRVGGAILLVGLALALLVAILLITGAFGGDDDGGEGTGSTQSTQTQTQAGEPQVEAQVNLQKPEGASGNAAGVAQVARQGNQRAVALVAQGLPRATQSRFYAIWLYSSPTKAKFLGFPNPQPDQNGRIETGFGLPNDANQFDQLVVTRETQERPERPGTIVLGGALDLPN